MKHPFIRHLSNQIRPKGSSGFTMIETLIAGIIVAAVMTAVGRLGISAMASSRNQSSRSSIEAAINDHIQLVQMQDSYLTADAIEAESGLNTDLATACKEPSTFLMNHLKRVDVAGNKPNPAVSMKWDNSDPYLLVLTYKFKAPESNIVDPESTIGEEQRMIEVNPNFSSQCYTLS